jgi:hypothetical protein
MLKSVSGNVLIEYICYQARRLTTFVSGARSIFEKLKAQTSIPTDMRNLT